MDPMFLGNALLMFGAFAMQFGLLGGGDDDEAETEAAEPETTPDEVLTLYDPANFGTELFGTDGDDTFDENGSPLSVAVFLQDGDDTLDATFQNDYAEGGAGDDDLTMRPGDDIALGGSGNDTIDGGLGDDTLFGDDGDDQITGNKDNDEIHGGAGNDTLIGSRGDDTLDGGSGNDVLYGNTDSDPGRTDDGTDQLSGGSGDDALHLGAGDQGTGGAGSDSFLLYDPAASGGVAEITDYDATADVIGIVYAPGLDPDTGDPVSPTVTVAANDEGTEGVVSLNGVEIARIIGGQDLTADNIALIPDT